MKYLYLFVFCVVACSNATSQESSLSTRFNAMFGAGKPIKSDYSGSALSFTLKGIYNFSSITYFDAGFGYCWLNSKNSALLNEPTQNKNRQTSIVMLPLGAGFTMGDGRAGFFTGLDIIPAYYISVEPEPKAIRRFVVGIAPEIGFTAKVGRWYQRGVEMGMFGTVQLLPSACKSDNYSPTQIFAGVGFVFCF